MIGKSGGRISIDARVLKRQVDYGRSFLVMETSRRIIAAKLRNCRSLLTNYRQSRQRSGSDQANLLIQCQNGLDFWRQHLDQTDARQQIFQIEARAAANYWPVIGLLCHQSSEWKRFYPHAVDSLNLLLNVGYTVLARQCLKSLEGSGLAPELGILHGDNSARPLAYDLMECFRQVAVDSVIVPVFSRRPKGGVEKDGKTFLKVIALLHHRYDRRFLYNHCCEKLSRIIDLEALKLKKAILKNKVWLPYHHQWRHRRKCQ